MKTLLIRLALPILLSLADELAKRDDDATGWDDETAQAIKVVVEKLQKYGLV